MGLHLKRVLTCLLILCYVVIPLTGFTQTAHAASSSQVKALEQKRRSKLSELRRIKLLKQQIIRKERAVTSNIVANQRRLEASRNSLEGQQKLMNEAKVRLVDLENSLDVAFADQKKLSVQVGKRLRAIYMGENLTVLNVLLDSESLSTMLDRLYYKQRIATQDRRLIKDYAKKTRVLEQRKNRLMLEKNRLALTIRRIEVFQGQLRDSMEIDRALVQKLRTSKQAYEAAEDQLQRESFSIERQILAATRRGGLILGSTGRLMAPVLAAVTSRFGYRVHPIFRTSRFHSGLDFGARHGAPIRAADGGRVIQSGWQGGYGKVVIINHGSRSGRNITTLYGHMSGTAVGIGQQVAKGQVVGYVGSTGFSTGPHLHFEVRENGRPVNPLGYLR